MNFNLLDGYRCGIAALETGKLYLRLSGGRTDLTERPDVPQDDDPVFGPLTWFKLYDTKTCGIEFQDGHSYLFIEHGPQVHVRNGMLWYLDLYYSPVLFIAK